MNATSLDEYMRIVTINQVGTFPRDEGRDRDDDRSRFGLDRQHLVVAGLAGSAGTIAYTASKSR